MTAVSSIPPSKTAAPSSLSPDSAAYLLIPKPSPEIELILCCARVDMDTYTAGKIGRLLEHELDWALLLRMASRHGLMPLLYWHLKEVEPDAVPEPILNELQAHFLENARWNLFLIGELAKVLALFQEHDIPAVPFKGPILSFSTYGNLAFREFTDLDILVPFDKFVRAKDLLFSQGYHSSLPLTERQAQKYVRSKSYCEYCFVHDNGTCLDVHWEFVPGFFASSLRLEDAWKRLEPFSLGGITVSTLAAEDFLFFHCMHGTRHLWQRLSWICDIAEFIRVHPEIDWEHVIDASVTKGSGRMVRLGLFLANDLLDAALPEKVLLWVRSDPMVRPLARQVQERLFEDADKPPRLPERLLFVTKARDGLRDKLLYLVSITITPSLAEWWLLPLPSFLAPLYFLLRPARLLLKHGLGCVKRLL